MKKWHMAGAISLAAALLCAAIPVTAAGSAAAAACTTAGNVTVTGAGVGTYYVDADNWGGGNVCVATDGKADFTAQSQSVAYRGGVLAYVNISAGCSGGSGLGCTPGWTSEKLSALGAPEQTWTTAGSANSAAEYDVANDIWTAPATTGCPDSELMILLNGQNLAAPPSTQVVIHGVAYYYKEYKASNASCSWRYIQFRRVTAVKSVTNMPLGPFFKYAEAQGLMSSSDYLRQICAGYELWSYGAGLKTASYSFMQ
jgi:hypothetical protein